MRRDTTAAPAELTLADERAEHNRYQRRYYETRKLPRMVPVCSPYVQQHLERVLQVARLDCSKPLLEVGAGLGRYTLPLLEQGFAVTALDLSPLLLERLRAAAPGHHVRTVACDIADAAAHLQERFDQAVGFFTLHHLRDLDAAMLALARALTPGARIAFCEPNGFNPLFYLQILLTPGMTWRGDGGVAKMRPRVVLGAMERAGFSDLGVEPFGLLPRSMRNREWGGRLERRLEATLPFHWMRAFQVFHGALAG